MSVGGRVMLQGWSAEQELSRRYRGVRVLLAEDEPVNQAVTVELLEGVITDEYPFCPGFMEMSLLRT